jgi:hypothetical protein
MKTGVFAGGARTFSRPDSLATYASENGGFGRQRISRVRRCRTLTTSFALLQVLIPIEQVTNC